QRRNSTRHRPPLLGQLAQRGTHEHPQTPVRSPDDHLIARPLAHRSPLVRSHHASLQPATPTSKPAHNGNLRGGAGHSAGTSYPALYGSARPASQPQENRLGRNAPLSAASEGLKLDDQEDQRCSSYKQQ